MNEGYGMPFELFFCPLRPQDWPNEDYFFSGGNSARYIGYSVWVQRLSPGGGVTPPEYIQAPSRVSDSTRRVNNPIITDNQIKWGGGKYGPDEFDPIWGRTHDYGGKVESTHLMFLGGNVESNSAGEMLNRYTSHNAENWY